MLTVEREWAEATEGKRTARRQIVAQDRDDPDRYFSAGRFERTVSGATVTRDTDS